MTEPVRMVMRPTPAALTEEDQARADLYALIARLLLAPPDDALLKSIAEAGGGGAEQGNSDFERNLRQLALASRTTEADAVREEFNALFVSIGTPLINPYSSYYLSGFLMEKPLAVLRADLADLGLGRRDGVNELEDHFGALAEAMRLLIAGSDLLPARDVVVQKAFFEKHLAPWYEQCMDDIRRAEAARYYRCVADFIESFLAVERTAFEIEGLRVDAYAMDE